MKTAGRSVGIAVVGAGFLGSQRAAACRRARGARLIAVHDVDQQSARAVAQAHRVPADDSLSAVLSRAEVDAVVIATPHAEHAKQARTCLEAGKHVLCEKPLTIDAREARDLVAFADERGLRLATGFNHRYYPPIRHALQHARAGAIGPIQRIRASIGHAASQDFLRSWHVDRTRSGGGTLIDNGPHACDLIRQILGEVRSAEGTVENHLNLPDGCESDAVARFEGRDGGCAELRSSWRQSSGYLTIDIEGTDGELHVETAPWRLFGRLSGERNVREHFLLERIKERLFRLRHGCERSIVSEIESFVSFAASRPKTHGSGWDGCRVTEMIQAAYKSASLGAAVTLNPLPARLPHVRASKRRAYG
jgi:predicted dehydrogenase